MKSELDKAAEEYARRNNVGWAEREVKNCIADFKAGHARGVQDERERAAVQDDKLRRDLDRANLAFYDERQRARKLVGAVSEIRFAVANDCTLLQIDELIHEALKEYEGGR